MEILIRSQAVYGQTLYYPVNGAAELLADIAGTKTLRPDDLDRALILGHEVNVILASGRYSMTAAWRELRSA